MMERQRAKVDICVYRKTLCVYTDISLVLFVLFCLFCTCYLFVYIIIIINKNKIYHICFCCLNFIYTQTLITKISI